ncbi:hypothetical protein L2729_18960 [Shewanella gelidimarina]|uniref:glycoside hydrolase family 97 catalytic domain-containing protein n=1 Tax=Shewanella gelidimarina TaxID=56813 RepID=UPI00200CEB6D|nr:hypothetical protein [Shewanella gelidimarina]MCL1060054.1 hypothetical protein [Shewanella gelidimarina]
MHLTPFIFDLAPKGLHALNRMQTTLTKKLAFYVVLYSPIAMAANLPRNDVERLIPSIYQGRTNRLGKALH